MVTTRSQMLENIENSENMDEGNVSNEGLAQLLDAKFIELRSSLLLDFKEQIKELVDKHKEDVLKLESTVAVLQNHVSYLKHDNEVLSKKIDENEQYGRRLCVRIEGVPAAESGKETAEDVYLLVENIIKEAEIEVPSSVLDRAHRIGKPQKPRKEG